MGDVPSQCLQSSPCVPEEEEVCLAEDGPTLALVFSGRSSVNKSHTDMAGHFLILLLHLVTVSARELDLLDPAEEGEESLVGRREHCTKVG